MNTLGSTKRCLAEQEMYDSVWKTCRDTGESKFDFSSPSLKRKRVVRDKCANKTCKKETNYNPLISMPYIPNCTMLSLEETQVNEVCSSPLDVGNSDDDSPSSATEIYVHELIIYQAITPCNHTLKTFVLQDYLEKSSSLKHRSFVFVKRTAKQFLDKVDWVYHII